jgi:ribonuclease J
VPKGELKKLVVIPLGGCGEIGKNMTAIECGEDIVVVDAGLAFPGDDMPGIDIVLPDINYLVERRARIRAVLLTHGHEDHIGGMPYLLREVRSPVHGTRLTLGMVRAKLEEHNLDLPKGSRPLQPGERLRVGVFEVEPFRVNHSIPDAVGFALHTPVGTVVHTGDFKFDYTPVDGEVADIDVLARLGRDGVLLLLADSTNVERPGQTPSEKTVGRVITDIMRQAKRRVIIASFASNVHRIQQVFDAAGQTGRRVAVIGRSMEKNVEVSLELGYLKAPRDLRLEIDEIGRIPADRVVILTTGSQGEPTSALTRMSTGDHRAVDILEGDTVILAATPVPGNEKSVHRTIDNLYRLGAEVVYLRDTGVHVSGHGSREELKLMHRLLRPRWFIPVHGEYRHLVLHAALARELGMPADHIVFGENGSVFEVTADTLRIIGKIPAGNVLVDGLGVGDVGSTVLRDRRQLSEDGILIIVVAVSRSEGRVVSGPEIISRGFVYVRESEELLEATRTRAAEALEQCRARRVTDWGAMKNAVRDAVGQQLYDKTRRRPMIMPIVLEV